MKKYFLILVIGLITLNLQAQLVLTTTAPGIVGVEYGNDYTLYDPAGETEIYLYIWVNSDQATPALPNNFVDEWSDSASLITINYSATEDKFIGEINFNTHDFANEGGVLPTGTTLDNFNLILRNEAGTAQSGDLVANNHGFAGTQTASVYDFQADTTSYYSNGLLYLNSLKTNELIEITVFDSAGKQLFAKEINTTNSSLQVDISHLTNTLAIVKVRTASNTHFTKKIVL